MAKFAVNDYIDRRFMFLKKICLPLPRGYIHAYDHFFLQISSSRKLRGQSKPNFIWNLSGKWGISL